MKGRRTEAVGTKTHFYSNMFKLTLKKSKTTIYQYVLDVTPAIGHDSTEFLGRIVASLKGELRRETGYFGHRGYMLWGVKGT